MDIADDIVYSTYDLEDAFKAGFISPMEMLIQNTDFYKEVGDKVSSNLSKDKHYKGRKNIDKDEIKNVISYRKKFLLQKCC